MKSTKKHMLVALVALLALVAAACGSDATDVVADAADDVADAADDAVDAVDDAADDAMDEVEDAVDDAMDEVSMPGEGKSGNMGRANWSTGYAHAQVLHDLLEELGYDISSPDALEFAPDLAYQTMAVGDMDFWANSWYPGHLSWFTGDLPDGTTIGENLERIEGSGMPAAGLQGLLVTKSWADAEGIGTLEDINNNPDLVAALDTDGNGKGEIYGCPEDWTCDDIIASQIAFAGWDNIEQTQAGYDAMFADFLGKVNNDEPAIMYTWAPTQYLAQAIPGQNVMWLSQETVLDDSNPLGIEGGEEYDQGEGFTALGEDTCTQGPSGCQTGWVGADIEVTANKAWLEDNPAARALFEVFNPPIIDVAIMDQQRAATDGAQADVEAIAANWIAANRDLVDGWLEVARAAG